MTAEILSIADIYIYPGFCTTSRNTLTASSLDIFSKLMSLT